MKLLVYNLICLAWQLFCGHGSLQERQQVIERLLILFDSQLRDFSVSLQQLDEQIISEIWLPNIIKHF